jgi:O-antigen/teichoic acid export membrane protein
MVILILLNVLVKPIWIFFIDRNVQQIVGHQSYGTYSALLNLSIMFSILLDYGVTNFNNKNIAEDANRLTVTLPNVIVAKLFFSIMYFIVILIIGVSLGYDVKALQILLSIASFQFLNSLLQYLRSNISALHDFKLDGLLSVLDKFLMIFICAVLLLNPVTKALFVIEWFVYAQIVSYLIAVLVAVLIIIKRYAKLDFSKTQFSVIVEVIKRGTPYAILILLMGTYMRVDTLMLERMVSAEQAGIYAQAYRILDTCNILGLLFAGMLLPMFARILNSNNSVLELLRVSANFMLPISLGVVAFSIVHANDIMALLYKDRSASSEFIFQCVMLCFPAFCVMYIYATLLTSNGSLRTLIMIACIGSITSIGLNYFFIQKWEAMAVASIAIFVHWMVAILYIIYCQKILRIPSNFKWVLRFFLLFIICIGVNLGAKFIELNIFIVLLINSIVFLFSVYALKFWNKYHILNLIQKYSA